MSGDFLPTYRAVPTCNGWKASYKLFVGEREKLVPGGVIFPSVSQAVQAAMDYVRVKLNPPIRSEIMPDDPDPLGVEKWRAERDGRAVEEQARVFGTEGPQTVFSPQGRPVVVERVKKRVVA